jgi:hypothetical protein
MPHEISLKSVFTSGVFDKKTSFSVFLNDSLGAARVFEVHSTFALIPKLNISPKNDITLRP